MENWSWDAECRTWSLRDAGLWRGWSTAVDRCAGANGRANRVASLEIAGSLPPPVRHAGRFPVNGRQPFFDPNEGRMTKWNLWAHAVWSRTSMRRSRSARAPTAKSAWPLRFFNSDGSDARSYSSYTGRGVVKYVACRSAGNMPFAFAALICVHPGPPAESTGAYGIQGVQL